MDDRDATPGTQPCPRHVTAHRSCRPGATTAHRWIEAKTHAVDTPASSTSTVRAASSRRMAPAASAPSRTANSHIPPMATATPRYPMPSLHTQVSAPSEPGATRFRRQPKQRDGGIYANHPAGSRPWTCDGHPYVSDATNNLRAADVLEALRGKRGRPLDRRRLHAVGRMAVVKRVGVRDHLAIARPLRPWRPYPKDPRS